MQADRGQEAEVDLTLGNLGVDRDQDLDREVNEVA